MRAQKDKEIGEISDIITEKEEQIEMDLKKLEAVQQIQDQVEPGEQKCDDNVHG